MFCSDRSITQQNINNIKAKIESLTNQTLKNECLRKIKSVKVSQSDSTVEYYLSDLKDSNRFQTSWSYVSEFIDDKVKKESLLSEIVKEFTYSKNVTQRNKDNLSNLISKLSSGKHKKELIKMMSSVELNQNDSTIE